MGQEQLQRCQNSGKTEAPAVQRVPAGAEQWGPGICSEPAGVRAGTAAANWGLLSLSLTDLILANLSSSLCCATSPPRHQIVPDGDETVSSIRPSSSGPLCTFWQG